MNDLYHFDLSKLEKSTSPEPVQEWLGSGDMRLSASYIKTAMFDALVIPEWVGPAMKVETSVNVKAHRVDKAQFESTVEFVAQAVDGSLGDIYKLCVRCSGLFEVEYVPPQPQLQAMLLVTGPELVFPLVQRVVVDLTHGAGLAPLLVQPVDFLAAYKRKRTGTEGEVAGSTDESACHQ